LEDFMKSRKAAAAVSAGALTLVIAGLGGGAAYAAGAGSLHAARDYSSASTVTNNGTQGKSYAKHGSLVASTGWTTRSSSAYADAGTSSTYAASVSFR
jgi:hypothetical protein